MATVRVLRTSGLILLLFLINTLAVSPWITSVDVDNALCDEFNCNYRIKVSGGLREWSLTSRVKNRGDVCSDNFMVEKSNVFVDLTVPVFDKLYFCVERDGVLYHEGPGLYLVGGDVISRVLPEASENEVIPDEIEDFSETDRKYYNDLNINKYGEEEDDGVETIPNSGIRKKREANETEVTDAETSSLGVKVVQTNVTLKIMGLRIEEGEKEPKIVDGMIPSVLRDTKFTLRLFGEGFTDDTSIAFTHHPQAYGSSCHFLIKGEYKINAAEHDSGLFELTAPPPLEDYKFYICARNTPDGDLIHQGSEGWKILATHNKLLPLWASLVLIVILLVMASLFSGLNLGLMALDRTELRIIANTGTETERKYARAIMPVRSHGNYLLCTILLSNVAVNSTFTVILDDLTSGLYAVIGSTLAIVFIAEITPQAICARHGLLIGAKSIWIMKIVMGICAPLAWPTSKLLDYFLGEEIGTHYNRERLKELVKVTNHVNDLDKEEVNIISGALDLRKKTVKDVMTKLKDCFMLPINTVLDFETMTEIVKSGYSRIPVYEGHRGNIVTVLFIKDLAFVDPDDNTPLRTLCQYYQNPCNFVFEDVTLDVMLKQFKEG
ncbi:unnamed protein product [Colias eurytheme]|nr:unnamed protein product [Colias eurytheme]